MTSAWTWDLDERTDAGVKLDLARGVLTWWAADKVLPGMTAHMVSGGEQDQSVADFLAGKPTPWKCPQAILGELRAALSA
ncbi:MAG: hypothetical protein QM817_36675 [Archangium sp.]